MRFLFTLLIIFLAAFSCSAQSDMLILKKRNHNVQSFFPGSPISFSTNIRYYEAYVTSIQRDSVFLVQYDIRPRLNYLSIPVLDTVSSYRFAVNYHDIVSFGTSTKKGFDWSSSGGALFGGGALLTVAGLTTWVFSKPDTRYYASPAFVISAAALTGIGYLILRGGHNAKILGKKYTLQYIKVK